MSDNDKLHTDESPTERLLREALAARADQVTAQSLRPAAPPKTRVRRLRPVVTVAVPLFGLAAGVLGFFTLNGSPTAMHQEQPPAASVSSSPSPEPTASPGQSPSPSATASSDGPSVPAGSPAAATQQQLQGVKFSLPAGWTVRSVDPSTVCLMTPGAPAASAGGGCFPYGVQLAAYTTAEEVANATWPTDADLDAPDGWSHQPYCPVWGNPHQISGAETSTYKPVGNPQRTTVAVNGHYASKTQWQVACNAKEQFAAQMWGFHKEQVFVVADGLAADYQIDLQSIVDSLDLSGHADPLKLGHATDVRVSFSSPAFGQPIPANGTPVTFSVTWTNVSSTTYSAVDPVVSTKPYSGGDPTLGMADGTLERQDGATWTKMPSLSQGGGMDYAKSGVAAAFPLAPGQSHTVSYRMTLGSKSGAGSLTLVAETFLPAGGGITTKVGDAQTSLAVNP